MELIEEYNKKHKKIEITNIDDTVLYLSLGPLKPGESMIANKSTSIIEELYAINSCIGKNIGIKNI